ncbi:predicted protein [Histoplasma mississippiense (nom. inval.)]|uniref:predicted protein n=1 Tax=Ajellomyces capsulatus (strain NAm1 / WU24) TaxID=2059318 RepID=UPI000157B698|nr:predicted protein [Histoplasma mississippiense (nom. inval.)]EDN02672.1 predicted protein [Histoplasma mississippiense (nom. inval.)]
MDIRPNKRKLKVKYVSSALVTIEWLLDLGKFVIGQTLKIHSMDKMDDLIGILFLRDQEDVYNLCSTSYVTLHGRAELALIVRVGADSKHIYLPPWSPWSPGAIRTAHVAILRWMS